MEKKLKEAQDKIAALSGVIKDQEVLIDTLSASLSEHTKLAEAAGEAMAGMQEELAEKAGDTVENAVADAVDSADTVSEETKGAIVDAVGQLDPELAAELTNEFAKADMADETIDGEKLGRSVLKILDKLSVSRRGYAGGRTVPKTDKTAARTSSGSYADKIRSEIQARYNS